MTLSEKIEKNITQRVIRFTLVLGILLFIIASSNNIYVLGASNGKWMLINTTINPNNQPTEFYGGGLTPDWLPDKMHLGREVIFTVSETSMSTKDHKVLRDRLYFDFTLTADFDKPPANLIPGETVQLSATVSGSGSGKYQVVAQAAILLIFLLGRVMVVVCPSSFSIGLKESNLMGGIKS